MKKRKKICLISSSGGHYEQLKMLDKLKEQYDIFYVTEKTKYSSKNDIFYIKQVNRKERMVIFKLVWILFQSLYIFLKEKPDVIISTGALSVIPMFFWGKLFRKKTIFIESFAKITSGTKTGKLLYKFSDIFIVQWKELLKIYPRAKYLGSIY